MAEEGTRALISHRHLLTSPAASGRCWTHGSSGCTHLAREPCRSCQSARLHHCSFYLNGADVDLKVTPRTTTQCTRRCSATLDELFLLWSQTQYESEKALSHLLCGMCIKLQLCTDEDEWSSGFGPVVFGTSAFTSKTFSFFNAIFFAILKYLFNFLKLWRCLL